jgi:hypothetical protein
MTAGDNLMVLRKSIVALLAAAGIFGAAALTLEVDIRFKNASAAAAKPSRLGGCSQALNG